MSDVEKLDATKNGVSASKSKLTTMEGNEAVASVAHRTNEVIAIYPISPASSMGEMADEWSAQDRKNIWGEVPTVVEMQSEAGAIGAVHGALQSGALTTTFTASQGLLLMIPNMYKIAGELTPYCMHVSARTVATHGLSIFGDQSDVMAVRQTGFALLASSSVQIAHDFACIGQAATLRARVPFLHFFDGYRTSHEVNKIEFLDDDTLRAIIDDDLVASHRSRALTPDDPKIRGTAQNPDSFFQMQEARNPYYEVCPDIVQQVMDEFATLTGRQYNLFEYFGHPEAEKLIIIMGSGADTVHETVDYLNHRGAKLGVVKVRLFRPFSMDKLIAAIPTSVRSIAVLDRTKEHGSLGEPLYQDVVTALAQAKSQGLRPTAIDPLVIGGRYGLSSKEFTPGMVKSVFDEMDADRPKSGFTVGIADDVTYLSLKWDANFSTETGDVKTAIFFGLGSDGTVGANKNSIKIISENTDNFSQGYFVYDSKKAGAVTISHLRFSPQPIRSAYLIEQAHFVACHQFNFMFEIDIVKHVETGGTFLLNSPYDKTEVWDKLPKSVQAEIIDKKLKFYVVNATKVARDTGMGRRINTVMQACFFGISGVLPQDEAIRQIKGAIERSYGSKGRDIVEMNFAAVDSSIDHLEEVDVPAQVTGDFEMPPVVPVDAPDFVKEVTAKMISRDGDLLPVSAFPVDGTWPTGTTQWEKRNLAIETPQWIPELCIQCNKCALVCPHACIRVKAYEPAVLDDAPDNFQAMDYKGKEFGEAKYTVQVSHEDCTGCNLCVSVCPGIDKADPERRSLFMEPHEYFASESDKQNWSFFTEIPEADRTKLRSNVKMSQFAEPLFEFSGACSGCGETPYIKLLTQLYGDHTVIANATGCSSIYGGNLPTTPYTTNKDGRGPAWANSLFEDNAEFGLGHRLAIDMHSAQARSLLERRSGDLDETLVNDMLAADQGDDAGIFAQRERVLKLRAALKTITGEDASRLDQLADYLVRKDVWIVGGDGWAYDIGYGGLDHVFASGQNVNILVMDTEGYSNTGGQQSKATSLGSAAKFAVSGKSQPKKDLGLLAIMSGNVYVASVAFGAKDAQTVRAFHEASSFDGPSIIIAYSPCIEHGYDLGLGIDQQTLAVDSGYWPLYRYDPRLFEAGKKPMQLDSKMPTVSLDALVENENRFQAVKRRDPERYADLMISAKAHLERRFALYEKLAEISLPEKPAGEET